MTRQTLILLMIIFFSRNIYSSNDTTSLLIAQRHFYNFSMTGIKDDSTSYHYNHDFKVDTLTNSSIHLNQKDFVDRSSYNFIDDSTYENFSERFYLGYWDFMGKSINKQFPTIFTNTGVTYGVIAFDTSKQLVPISKDTTIFFADEKMRKRVSYSFDSIFYLLQNTEIQKDIFQRDSIDEGFEYLCFSNTLKRHYKMIFFYDSNKTKPYRTDFYSSKNIDTVAFESYSLYTYDSVGNVLSWKQINPFSVGDSSLNVFGNRYHYNSNNLLDSAFQYNQHDSGYIPVIHLTVFDYNQVGLKTKESDYWKAADSVNYQLSRWTDYQYNSKNQIKKEIYTGMNYDSARFVVRDSVVYYYKTKSEISSITEFQFNIGRVYPNPFKEKIVIELENKQETFWSLFDFSGRKLKEGEIIDASSIELNEIPNGLYFLKLKNSIGSEVKKIIKVE